MLKQKSSFNSCVVLDIDETLIHTKYTTDKQDESLKKKSDISFKINGIYYYILVRPNAVSFLKAVFEKFEHVCIWTAAEKLYAKKIISNLFTEKQEASLLEFWSRKNCVIKDGNYTKPLTKLFNKHKFLNLKNTVLIDNNNLITKLNKNMSINVPDYTGQKNDKILLKLTPLRTINSEQKLTLYKNKLK